MTKDGVTVVKNIRVKDPKLELGVALMRQVAHNANEFCGDGTTTATVLAHGIMEKGLKAIEAGYNPIDLKRGIDLAKREIVDFYSERVLF